MTDNDITWRKVQTEARLDALRAQRGIAMLDGTEFDSATVTELEQELDALTSAEGEAARRERVLLAQAEEQRQDNLRQLLAMVNDQRMEGIERAEKAAHELTDALKDVMARSADTVKIVRALDCGPALRLDAYEVESRLSQRLTAALKPVTGLRRRFGHIMFPEAQTRYAGTWVAGESAETEHDISRALKGSSK